MEKGSVQIYYGAGRGKTNAAGQCVAGSRRE